MIQKHPKTLFLAKTLDITGSNLLIYKLSTKLSTGFSG